ncbi:MAG: cobalamin-dependent protein, partial [Clostridiales bacterium]|nr:cobalamin-dependent protein [Clostridiales bacterium]
MKIALCALNAKHSHSCLALYSLREAARAPGREIAISEHTINQDSGLALRDIYSLKPDVCCFSISIWSAAQTLSIIDRLKSVLPNCVIICGGPEASFESKSLFSSKIDAVAKGEGESVFSMALCAIENGVGFSKTPGLIYRDGLDVRENEDAPLIDMASLPFPYRNGLHEFAHRILYYESS